MEKKISFNSDSVTLEGMWRQSSLQSAAIICHPHPLYGGDMQNPVVITAGDHYAQKGISTLRFNFRGVGRSTGSYDNGNGEQKDVLAAIEWIKNKGIRQIHLAGYSYGAWILALIACGNTSITDLVMISPPVAFIKFPGSMALSSLSLVIIGEQDDIAPPAQVRSQLKNWNPRAELKILPNTDHFFTNALPDLASALSEHQPLSND